ncbi:MAG TPA: hypothetical protein VGV37_11685 [Aliidongia sp.]|uniref:hypothetical protein n=1 Tax=Aliidongia sp. TaxID=1914230 RepID=UPI002DDCED84|nr:hypothetical protein [Aliidongia sp.]HEV2675193.1 hypothetical protein [Aliidongia sp.]
MAHFDPFTALWTAAATVTLGFFLKEISEWRLKRQKRRSVAGALAGEMGAYLYLMKPDQIAENFTKIARLEKLIRTQRLKALNELPDSHPVFDAIAKDIGELPPKLAQEVSSFHNVVGGARLMFLSIRKSEFHDADEAFQQNFLITVPALMAEKLLEGKATVEALIKLSG